MRLYVDRHRLGLVEGEDLRRALEDASGRPLRWYFDQWVYGKGTAAWTVADRWKDGQLELTITPKGDGPVFHVPLTVEVGLPDGPVERTVWLDGTPVKLVVPAAREPLFVAVDPERGVPGTLEHTQSPARWLAQLQGSKHAQARLVALTHLGEGDPEPDVLDALEALATSGVDVTLRSRAVRALGGHGADERAEGFLLARLDDPQALVRREAVRGLPATPASLAALERALDDPHGWVRSAAFSRLEEHDPDRATEVAGRILKRADPSRVGYLHFLAIHRLADAGVVGSVPSFTADPRALVRRAALYATAELIREAELSDRERVRLQRVLADAIAVALQDPELRVREDAVEAARALRLTDIPMLERFVADNPIPELDTAARTSIAAIRNPAPDDDGLAKRLDALVERMDAMQGALDGAVERLDALGPQ
ncbi:MAG: HEAT repeat domain-containing protein [Alphaproteobacteria bacterium]|nr:HEAT repeat domain-containing protein [Alphaproteobacteria bacterium]